MKLSLDIEAVTNGVSRLAALEQENGRLFRENNRLHADRASADCIRCWHPRARHIGRAELDEPCDEDGCECLGFVDRRERL